MRTYIVVAVAPSVAVAVLAIEHGKQSSMKSKEVMTHVLEATERRLRSVCPPTFTTVPTPHHDAALLANSHPACEDLSDALYADDSTAG